MSWCTVGEFQCRMRVAKTAHFLHKRTVKLTKKTGRPFGGLSYTHPTLKFPHHAQQYLNAGAI